MPVFDRAIPINPRATAEDIRHALDLAPHPEGGWYRETYRAEPAAPEMRGAVTAIYFLLAAGETSEPHRIDATELWLWHAGAALDLTVGSTLISLGPDLSQNQSLQAVVPPCIWQSAKSSGAWTLVSCIVAPAFSFSGFELRPARSDQS